MKIEEIRNKIKILEENYKAEVVLKDMYIRNLKTKQDEYSNIKKKIELLDKSVIILKKFNSTIGKEIIQKFEELITKGIREIFEKDYKFIIDLDFNNSVAPTAEFLIKIPDKDKIINISKGEGGGIRDFVSVLIRILYLILEPTKPAKILFLDENLKHLDRIRAIKAIKFIKELSEKLNIQIIFITHLDVNSYDIGNVNKISIQ